MISVEFAYLSHNLCRSSADCSRVLDQAQRRNNQNIPEIIIEIFETTHYFSSYHMISDIPTLLLFRNANDDGKEHHPRAKTDGGTFARGEISSWQKFPGNLDLSPFLHRRTFHIRFEAFHGPNHKQRYAQKRPVLIRFRSALVDGPLNLYTRCYGRWQFR